MNYYNNSVGALPILSYLALRERGPVACGSIHSLNEAFHRMTTRHVLVLTKEAAAALSAYGDFFDPVTSYSLLRTGLLGRMLGGLVITDHALQSRHWYERMWQWVDALRVWPHANPGFKLRRFMHPSYAWAVYHIPVDLAYDTYK